jgi:hypothetical protein
MTGGQDVAPVQKRPAGCVQRWLDLVVLASTGRHGFRYAPFLARMGAHDNQSNPYSVSLGDDSRVPHGS